MDFDRAVAFNDFDDGTFEEEEANMDEDDISLGSEENEYDPSHEGEFDNDCDNKEEELHDNVVGGQVEVDVNLVQEGFGHEQNDEEEECNDGSMPSFGNHEDGRFSYAAEEIRMLKQAHVHIPTVSNAKDLSMIHRAICDSNLFENEFVIDSENPQFAMKQLAWPAAVREQGKVLCPGSVAPSRPARQTGLVAPSRLTTGATALHCHAILDGATGLCYCASVSIEPVRFGLDGPHCANGERWRDSTVLSRQLKRRDKTYLSRLRVN
ncbi:hypothetical protein C2845_PM07G06840 [Panicum miliaceum]|uniref:Uncharacterized protein n=1 Tax=Panicum miliaceum TaxID=4540 RepID=A0A3L6SKH5_PANMI|nr:hypothetical protein C2845_PM07G06840 [Panicum miliaceum]